MPAADTTPAAVQLCHDLLGWLIPLLDQFPRSRRFTLGERLESGLLAVLESLVDAAYSREKAEQLAAANRRLAVNRHLWRSAIPNLGAKLRVCRAAARAPFPQRLSARGRGASSGVFGARKPIPAAPLGQRAGDDLHRPKPALRTKPVRSAAEQDESRQNP